MLLTSAGIEPATSWSPIGRRIQLSHRGRHLADTQADLSLRCAHIHFVGFVIRLLKFAFWYMNGAFLDRTIILSSRTIAPQRKKTYLRTCTPSEDSDQPAPSHSLIKIFTECILDSQFKNATFLHTDKEDWSDCADAQAYLSLRWAHILEGTFSHVKSQYLGDQLCHSFDWSAPVQWISRFREVINTSPIMFTKWW